MAFTYLEVKSAKCFCLLPVVLVLVLKVWSCLHHWIQHSRFSVKMSASTSVGTQNLGLIT